ncbi:winged helix-turn-helix transcriptional regulator [Gemella cuniculi]|uniref:winged helix-turn-helix transcriptional regulator n=1 Tax=Gemella cuniculi TaxID=150240 RepID=UPI0003F65EF1|nr:helix-turn-helix domain-containing protein [Gemella cuniculi]
MTSKKLPDKLPACPVETTLLLLSNKWTILILRDLFEGTMRFGELKKSLGAVSQKVLTENLRSLENKGVINRKVYPEVPPRVEYSLTELGYSLKPIIDSMHEWGVFYKTNYEN